MKNQLPLDVISIQGLQVQCIVGLYPHERTNPQPVELDVALHLHTSSVHELGIRGTVDYALIASEIEFLLTRCRFVLIEHAAEALARYLLAPPTADVPQPQVHSVTLTLRKPSALPGKGVPSITITRHARDMHFTIETKPFGQVDVLYENAALGIYRLRIKPQGCIPTHFHRMREEHEWVRGDGLLLQNQRVSRGTLIDWPKDFPHRYDNPTDIEQSILCVDVPKFSQDDDVEVSFPKEKLTLPEAGAVP